MADSILSLHLVRRGLTPATAAARLLRDDARDTLAALAEEIEGVRSGAREGRYTLRVDSSARVAASQTITCDQSDSNAGDVVIFTVPGRGSVTFTAVAGSADAGEYSIDTSDSAMATSLAAAFEADSFASKYVSAEANSAIVTLTAKEPGATANGYILSKLVTTSTAIQLGGATFSGGVDPGDQADVTVTFGSADIAADDTITIGSVTLTWKASAASEDEITLDTDPADAADAFVAAVNAHSKLRGLVVASEDSTTVVRLTYQGDPRAGELLPISRTETNSGSVTLSAALFGSGATEAYGADAVTYTLGAP